MMNSNALPRLFILGAPRSGTTFLASLLEDTRFGAPIETHFITKYYKNIDQYGDLSRQENFVRLAEDVLSERPVMQWRLDVTPATLYEELGPTPTFTTLVDYLLLSMRRQKTGRAQAWGDKTPHYLGDWRILFKLFPDAKFIFIARDGRDVALSLLQKPWGPSTIIGCAAYWARLNREYQTLEQELPRAQLISLGYETLVSDTEKHVRALYAFLEEPLNESRLEELVAPTKRENTEKWRSLMTRTQIRQFEAVAGGQLQALGYTLECSEPRLYLGEALWSRCLEAYGRVWFLFKANVIDGFKIRVLGKEPFAD